MPPARIIGDSGTEGNTKVIGVNKASAEEIKEKMEQQLRIQRAAHQQKRALEMKNAQGQIIKVVGNTTQGREFFFYCLFDEQMIFMSFYVDPLIVNEIRVGRSLTVDG